MIESSLDGLSASIRDLIDACERTGRRHDWRFEPTGAASREWAIHEMPGPFGTQPLEDAYRTGSLLWYAVADSGRGLADVLSSRRPLAMLSMARATAEASARCWYLLEHGPSPEERVRRMVNDRLHALDEDGRLAVSAGAEDTEWQQSATDALLDGANELGLEVHKAARYSAAYVGSTPRPSTMRILADLTKHTQFAALFYRWTSAVAHAALHGIAKELEIESIEDQTRTRLRVLTAEDAVAHLFVPMRALVAVTQQLAEQAGWDQSEIDAGSAQLLTVCQALMEQPSD